MFIKTGYKKRPVKFLELYEHDGWKIKIYSISLRNGFVSNELLESAKANIPAWLKNSSNYPLEVHKYATLILHESKEGNFVIINWWIDENMLQQHVYVSSYEDPSTLNLYSDKGITTCVWEMAVLWFERNAWVQFVLMNPDSPDIEKYLAAQFNGEV